jgi:hypothetical protein
MPYILPPNISLNSNSPIRTYPVDTSRPRHLHEDITQTTPNTHPHHLRHPLHTPPITPNTYNDLRETFDTLWIADTVHSDHHQPVSLPLLPLHHLHTTDVQINRLAPIYRRLDCLSPTHYGRFLRCPFTTDPSNITMPASRRIPPPARTPYSRTSNGIVDRAAARLLRDANGPSPIIVQSTPAERDLLSRGSTVTLPERGEAIWPRITGQGRDFYTYRALRSRYQEGHEHDDLFFLMDLAWNAVCEHAILESQNSGPTTAAAIAEGKSYAYHLKGLISHLYDQSWAEYLVHGPRDSGEILEWPARTALKRLVDRAFAVLAAVTALERPYQQAQVAWRDLIDKLVVELRRPVRAVRIRPDAQAVGGNIEMAPTSPIVATSSPGPDFRTALDRRIRSTRDPARTARRLPNVPSSLVDPNSPRQQPAAGNIPSSSPVQVPRQEPQSPDSPLRPRSRPVPAQSLSQENWLPAPVTDELSHLLPPLVPISFLRTKEHHLSLHPVPIGPWTMVTMKWNPFSERTAPSDQSSSLPVKRLGERCQLNMRIGSGYTVSKGTTTCSLTPSTRPGTRSFSDAHHPSSDFTLARPGDLGRCQWREMISRQRFGGIIIEGAGSSKRRG